MTTYSNWNGNCVGCTTGTAAGGANGWYCLADNTCWGTAACGTAPCTQTGRGNLFCNPQQSQCSNGGPLAAGTIASIVLAIVLVVFFITLIVWCLRRNRPATVVVAARRAPPPSPPMPVAGGDGVTPNYGTYSAHTAVNDGRVGVEKTY